MHLASYCHGIHFVGECITRLTLLLLFLQAGLTLGSQHHDSGHLTYVQFSFSADRTTCFPGPLSLLKRASQKQKEASLLWRLTLTRFTPAVCRRHIVI